MGDTNILNHATNSSEGQKKSKRCVCVQINGDFTDLFFYTTAVGGSDDQKHDKM